MVRADIRQHDAGTGPRECLRLPETDAAAAAGDERYLPRKILHYISPDPASLDAVCSGAWAADDYRPRLWSPKGSPDFRPQRGRSRT
jgi:hypothetical protein